MIAYLRETKWVDERTRANYREYMLATIALHTGVGARFKSKLNDLLPAWLKKAKPDPLRDAQRLAEAKAAIRAAQAKKKLK